MARRIARIAAGFHAPAHQADRALRRPVRGDAADRLALGLRGDQPGGATPGAQRTDRQPARCSTGCGRCAPTGCARAPACCPGTSASARRWRPAMRPTIVSALENLKQRFGIDAAFIVATDGQHDRRGRPGAGRRRRRGLTKALRQRRGSVRRRDAGRRALPGDGRAGDVAGPDRLAGVRRAAGPRRDDRAGEALAPFR